MNRCLDIQWGMHVAERDKVCVHVCGLCVCLIQCAYCGEVMYPVHGSV